MSSTSTVIPALSAARRPSSSESGDDSRSGMSRARTRSGPRARAQSAAQTLLSTPPDRPRTTPRLRIRCTTADSIAAAISAVTCTGSIRSRSIETLGANVTCRRLERAALLSHEPHDVVERVDVLGDGLVVVDLDVEPRLQEREQLDDADRVDEPAFSERLRAGQVTQIASESEVFSEKRANVLLDCRHLLTPVKGATGVRSWIPWNFGTSRSPSALTSLPRTNRTIVCTRILASSHRLA